MSNKCYLSIKNLFLFALLLPLAVTSQVKNVVTTHRVFPKIDKVLEFEKALTAHAQKYHTGDVKWRVFEIQSGPDFGGYQITEGPTSWEALDTRGNLGTEHNNDWHKTVAIYLTDKQSGNYGTYVDSLSTIALGDFSDKINITHVIPKPGCINRTAAILYDLKKAWTASGTTVAVYASSSSGPAQYALVTRYKQGLKEKADGFRPPFRATYEGVNGGNSFDLYLENVREFTEQAWSELLFMRADLSSK
jgi:hypothetical protein